MIFNFNVGRIHGYHSRMGVGRGSDGGHWGIRAGAVNSKRAKNVNSKLGTDQRTDGRTKLGVESRSTQQKTSQTQIGLNAMLRGLGQSYGWVGTVMWLSRGNDTHIVS